jgi:hypothetical protein
VATPEHKVKQFAKDRLKKELPDAWVYSPPGGMYGQAGVSDIIGLWHKVFFAIECKADATKKPTELQMRYLIHVGNQGGVAAVLKGKDRNRMDLIINSIKDLAAKREALYGAENSVREVRLATEQSGACSLSASDTDD